MTRFKFFLPILLLVSVCGHGCVYLIVGSVAALGGYSVSPDTVQGDLERDFNEVWDSAVDIASIMGSVDFKADKLGQIEATVSGAKVTIEVTSMTSRFVRIRVKARKNLLPSIKTAQDVYAKIVRNLDE